MNDIPLIPPSPTEDDYVAQVSAAQPPPLLDERDPIALFQTWLREAGSVEPNDPGAMTLATVDGEGMPNSRMVLLKGVDAAGFVFYTNSQSAKGQELSANPKAALGFHWKSLRRVVRVRGAVEATTQDEADAYFATRARAAQIGAWASEQSGVMPGPLALERRIAQVGLRFGLGKVTRPPHWLGYRVVPRSIEFWRDRHFRLHERLVFTRCGDGWTTSRLYP